MYKTAIEYYQEPIRKPIDYSRYNGPVRQVQPVKEQFVPKVNNPVVEKLSDNHTKRPHMKWQTKNHSNMSNPTVWGAAFWFTLHNGSAKYPISASHIVRERMKAYIIGIPHMLPCATCQIHATNHIEKNKDNLDDICSGREKLFKFFVDFHNIVNKRYNKPIVSVEEAYEMYNGGVQVSTLSYA